VTSSLYARPESRHTTTSETLFGWPPILPDMGGTSEVAVLGTCDRENPLAGAFSVILSAVPSWSGAYRLHADVIDNHDSANRGIIVALEHSVPCTEIGASHGIIR